MPKDLGVWCSPLHVAMHVVLLTSADVYRKFHHSVLRWGCIYVFQVLMFEYVNLPSPYFCKRKKKENKRDVGGHSVILS